MCVIDLKGQCEVWNEVERTARKPHRCSCCQAEILPGHRYCSHFSKFEGDVTAEKMCGACQEARGAFAHAHDSALPCPSYFLTLLEECIADGDEESERQWTPMLAAIRAWRAV